MGLKVCLDVLTRYLEGIPKYFLFWKNRKFILASKIRSETDFFSSIFFFLIPG